MSRTIIHLDMDAFYASVEQKDDPALRGRPVVVGGSGKRGVVSAASYEARIFGIRSAVPMFEARRRCPSGVFLPVRMERYAEISRAIFAIFREYTPLVEPLSLDEAFLDVTASSTLFGSGVRIAEQIRKRVREETGLTVSAGVAPNKFLAKIASDLHKPDGLTVVDPDHVQDFLAPLPVSRVWGVGAVGQDALRRMGVGTIAELRALPRDALESRFGTQGIRLYELSRGIDDRPVETAGEPKSLGREETYGQDLLDLDVMRTRLLDLAERSARRLRKRGLAGSTVTLKVRYSDFSTVTRSRTLTSPTDDGGVIFAEIVRLLADTEAGTRPVRLLGVSLAGLSPKGLVRQAGLFDAQEKRRDRLNATLDDLAERFGGDVVVRSRLLGEPEKEGDADKGSKIVDKQGP